METVLDLGVSVRAIKTVVGLFSGGGGLDLGFERAGFGVSVCVDNDPVACETLRHNRPEWPVFCGDIREFDPIPHRGAVGVIGGPPCQGFSTAGKGDPDDPRNFLWREWFRVVEAVEPEFVMLENVPGMAHSKNREHLDDLLEHLERDGYRVNYSVLDAADFGVPQRRRRLIVVGGRGFDIRLPKPSASRRVTVGEAILDLVDRTALNHEPNDHAQHVVDRWSRLAPGESDPGYRRSRLDARLPSVTIRAGGGYGPKGNHLGGFHPPIHPTLPRQLTVREAARLQTFPDDWEFKGPKTIQGRQVGNAVPPALAEAVAREIIAALEKRRMIPASRSTAETGAETKALQHLT